MYYRNRRFDLDVNNIPSATETFWKELDLIDVAGQSPLDTPPSQKSSCSKSLMVEYIKPSERGLAHQTFLSGDELPCGFKLRNYEVCGKCSCDCGGQVHNIELKIAEKDLWRWERAGKMIRSIILESPSISIKKRASDSRQRSVASGNIDVGRDAQGDIVEPPESHTARSTSNSSPETPVETLQGIIDRTQERPVKQQIAPSGDVPLRPGTFLSCRHGERFFGGRETNQMGPVDSVYKVAKDSRFCARAKNLQTETAVNLLRLLHEELSFLNAEPNKKWSWLLILILTIAYGGTHMIAWNYSFPSVVERLLWKSSCITLMLFVLLCRYALTPTPSALNIVSCLTGSALTIVIFTACAFARVFIVVESFISLRSVPIGVYATIPWANYVPHI